MAATTAITVDMIKNFKVHDICEGNVICNHGSVITLEDGRKARGMLNKLQIFSILQALENNEKLSAILCNFGWEHWISYDRDYYEYEVDREADVILTKIFQKTLKTPVTLSMVEHFTLEEDCTKGENCHHTVGITLKDKEETFFSLKASNIIPILEGLQASETVSEDSKNFRKEHFAGARKYVKASAGEILTKKFQQLF